MKKSISRIVFLFLIFTAAAGLFAQEAIKSIEANYYDFLSLTGIVNHPTLGYRTLSDSVWSFNEIEAFEENEDGTFTKVRISGENSPNHIWHKNNLGTTYTLWEASSPASNWFARGLKQGLFVRIYGPEWFNSHNTAFPYGQNDGALWQGKGYNTSLSTGLRLEGYGFELTFKPQLTWNQNKDFKINTDIYPNQYSYSFRAGTVGQDIDIVQRYGDKSFWNYDWGDTEARWSFYSLTFGFGTQNPWLGPAYLNPMLGSNNAPGYFKFDAGLRKTEIVLPFLGWSLGYIEGRMWLGQLEESEYFDNNPDNNKRMITGLSASYNPSFIPGFTIGLNRVFVTYWKRENFIYLLNLLSKKHFNSTGSTNDEDQKFSIFAEWVFPKAGFTVYGEYGRDDFSSSEIRNPFHTAIFTVGAKQRIPLHFAKLFTKLPEFFTLESELVFEYNNFEMSQDYQFQWAYMGYYSHGFVRQGYTHKGQVLGGAYGSFGNSQLLEYIIYHEKGNFTFNLHRYCPNNNLVYSQAVNTSADYYNESENSVYNTWYNNFETHMCYSIGTTFYVNKNMSITGSYTRDSIWYKDYVEDDDPNNYYVSLSVDYNF